MSNKEVENRICNFCESQYKLSYSLEDTSGFSKHCPFCGNEHNDEDYDLNEDDN